MMRLRLVGLLCLCLSAFAQAAPDIAIPPTLEQWVPWVLEGKEAINCPFEQDNNKARQCAWPQTLSLDLHDQDGTFTQRWTVFEESWIALPGSQKHWPQDVAVDGKPAVVTDKKGFPFIHLPKGRYRLTGHFLWSALPESIKLPATTGLIDVVLNKQHMEFPSIEADGRLWLNTSQSKAAVEDRLTVDVFRRVIDDIPLRLVTRLDLNVTGQPREVVLGPLLSKDYVPLQVSGPLPLRLEVDGRLRLQVRPGHWVVEVEARHKGPVDHLSIIPSDLPQSEIWVFEAKPSLRLVEIKGVDSVDPRQTRLPKEWQHLPAYRVSTSDSMQIVTKRRGDPDPAANELTLNRNLWLDFDGKGYTFQDQIQGQMRRGWRLSMTPDMTLGRAVVNGVDQLVTRLAAGGEQGIEVRQGGIMVEADGRYEGDISRVPAIGWKENFHQVKATLHLPPGWRLFAASGADSVGGASWIDRWTLLDIFLVLIGTLAIYRLLGVAWGAIALVCFVLTWHESAAPQYIWLLVIATMALMRVAPEGRLRKSMVMLRYLSLVGLVAIAIPYMVGAVRTAIYPQLEQPSVSAYPASISVSRDQAVEEGLQEKKVISGMVQAPMEARRRSMLSYESLYSDVVDPRSKVQTGPGLPEWRWSSVPVRWNGPVHEGQMLGLSLLPPGVTSTLKLISVILVLLLGLRLAGVALHGRRLSVEVVKFSLMALLLGGGLIATPEKAMADIPSPELLQTLQERLLAPPECLPQCAQISRMKLHVDNELIQIRLEVHASEDVAVPVPSEISGWMPIRSMLDGKPNVARRGPHNAVWVFVPQGRHQIQIAGPIRPVRALQIPLPLKPRHIDVTAKGWTVKGVHEDGTIEQALQLEREAWEGEQIKELEQTILPPFVTVSRVLRLGLDWRLQTEVKRVSPLGSAIALEIPLIAGESVTTEGIRVAQDKAIIQFAPQQQVIQWESVLTPSDSLTLHAIDTLDWVEEWRLDVSPIWHAELSGIPQIHHQSKRGMWFPQWHPWPGEDVTIRITRPMGVAGNTKTINHTQLTVKPGQRATDVTLEMRLRSSQADQHVITLPPGAKLGAVLINNRSQPIRQERGGVVRLPISPGEQRITLNWQSPNGISTLFRTPAVNLGIPSVNSNIDVQVPRSRWTLFTFGPRLGPAVLFWGILIVVAIIAFGLGRTKQTPLKTHQWLLLGIGLSQAILGVAMLVVGWLFAMAWRKRYGDRLQSQNFNAVQVALGIVTLAALCGLVGAVGIGLLGHPDMQISGNGSSSFVLKWYADHADETFPIATVISAPMWLYRILMLAWSLWLAFVLLGWLKWSWQCFTTGGLWQQLREKAMKKKTAKAPSADPWIEETPKLEAEKERPPGSPPDVTQ
jgi:hypothetical protein